MVKETLPSAAEERSRLRTAKAVHQDSGLKMARKKRTGKVPSLHDDSSPSHNCFSRIREESPPLPLCQNDLRSCLGLSETESVLPLPEVPVTEGPSGTPFPEPPSAQLKNRRFVFQKVELKPNSSKSFAGVKFTMKSLAPIEGTVRQSDALLRRPRSKAFLMKKLNTLCDDDSNLILKEPLCGQDSEVSPYISAYRRKTLFKSEGSFDRQPAFPSPFEQGPQGGNPTCHCRNSQCLKLYCECFKTFGLCNEACGCVDCKNRKDDSERRSAISKVLNSKYGRTKFQSSLKERLTELNHSEDLSTGVVYSVLKLDEAACQCRKSFCSNKYCSCHAGGRKCSGTCQCLECLNK